MTRQQLTFDGGEAPQCRVGTAVECRSGHTHIVLVHPHQQGVGDAAEQASVGQLWFSGRLGMAAGSCRPLATN